jgi:hypothetical protein
MSFPGLDNQQFSEKTLKGFLLKNLDLGNNNPSVQQLNAFLVKRVDEFWDQVVVPLCSDDKFDGNKINWYFEIYKEGLDARRLGAHPFTFFEIQESEIRKLVDFYNGKTLNEYIELGTSFLSNSYSMLTAWIRDQMVHLRLEHIYSSTNPVDWINRAEEEEKGIMDKKPDQVEGMVEVINNIGLIMSRRV